MLQQLGFLPQRQFHVLISLPGQELNLTVLPHNDGHFKVIEHGDVLGEVDLTPDYKCVHRSGKLNNNIIKQLEQHISDYYGRFKELFG
ncbi:hypothetical protein ACFQZS_06890 [Mucilaginibacter calamicampi]|uniref:Uncharacterized protein n=1 Tax=Mucilaginibacter calamicampi TaxID=1302352 RepID=A0ABW2YWU8_9SPHI